MLLQSFYWADQWVQTRSTTKIMGLRRPVLSKTCNSWYQLWITNWTGIYDGYANKITP